MTRQPWFGRYWVARRGRYRYKPIAWQGWAAMLAAILAPHLVWLAPGIDRVHPLIRLAIMMVILLLALFAMARLVRSRNVDVDIS